MGSLTLLTPVAALLAAAVALPLAAVVVAARRSERARALLRLPSAPRDRRRPILVASAFVLLAAAAAQPAVERVRGRAVRTDAEAFVVIDVSRSMAASQSPLSQTRLERAKMIARTVRARLDAVPTGVATLTDRLLPHLLPTADTAAFEATVQKALDVERPPARDRALQATTLRALAHVVEGAYFSTQARRRLLVVLTDGDSEPFDVEGVARALTAARTRLELVRVGDTSERVYAPDGTPEPLYRPSPTAAQTLVALADAANGVAVEGAADAAQAAEDFVGRGPTETEGVATDVVSLAAAFAAAALVPLALLIAEGLPRARSTIRAGWPRAATR